jgi:arginyl-tRNA synthetase
VSDAIRAELERVAAGFGAGGLEFVLERPRDAGHGDLATNLAMLLARRERINPRDMATRVVGELRFPPTVVSRTEIAGPGFSNFWLAENQLAGAVAEILDRGPKYGRTTEDAALKINIEFVSANPTGPLHVGHGRGAALGDAIASLYEWTGHAVTREFYINGCYGINITGFSFCFLSNGLCNSNCFCPFFKFIRGGRRPERMKIAHSYSPVSHCTGWVFINNFGKHFFCFIVFE